MGILSEVREWAEERASVYVLVILGVLCWMLLAVSIVMLVFDILASYHGWAKLLIDWIDLPNATFLGYVIAIVPTVIQLTFIVSKVADFTLLSEHKFFVTISYLCFIADNALDVFSMTRFDDVAMVTKSIFAAVLIAVFFFTVLSELLFGLFGPISFTMLDSLIRKVTSTDMLKLKASDFGPSTRR